MTSWHKPVVHDGQPLDETLGSSLAAPASRIADPTALGILPVSSTHFTLPTNRPT